MSLRDPPVKAHVDPPAVAGGSRRLLWHALAMLTAAAVAWLIFSAYRQPDLILDLAGMRLC